MFSFSCLLSVATMSEVVKVLPSPVKSIPFQPCPQENCSPFFKQARAAMKISAQQQQNTRHNTQKKRRRRRNNKTSNKRHATDEQQQRKTLCFHIVTTHCCCHQTSVNQSSQQLDPSLSSAYLTLPCKYSSSFQSHLPYER